MSPATPPPEATDPIVDLTNIAKNFYDTADKLRLTSVGLPDNQADTILEKAQESTEGGNAFTALAMSAILDTIVPALANIKKVTGEACDQVNHLKTVDQIISIATLLVAVGTAAASANSAGIIAAVQALADGLTGTTPASSSSSLTSAAS